MHSTLPPHPHTSLSDSGLQIYRLWVVLNRDMRIIVFPCLVYCVSTGKDSSNRVSNLVTTYSLFMQYSESLQSLSQERQAPTSLQASRLKWLSPMCHVVLGSTLCALRSCARASYGHHDKSRKLWDPRLRTPT